MSMNGEEGTGELLERMMVARAARYWRAVLLAGIAWLILAWMVRMDVRSLAAVGVLIGGLPRRGPSTRPPSDRR